MKKMLIAIVIASIALGGNYFMRKGNTGNAKLISYTTITVKKGEIENKILSTGTIEPYTRVEVNSSVSGRIDRVMANEGDRVKEGDVLAWISGEDRIALLDAARSTLESAQKTNDSASIAEAMAEYEIAEKAYKIVPLTNSIPGEVIVRSCEPGQNVSTATVLFVISDRLVANVAVDEADIGKVIRGQETRITLDAYPDEKLSGHVTKISREGDLVSDVVQYEVMVDPVEVPSYWASGMTANVEFIVNSKTDILVLPKSAVEEDEDGSYVTVMESHPISRPIETGITDGKMIEITQGLGEGEKVLQSGAKSGVTESDNSKSNRALQKDFGPPPMMMGGPR